ncbi:MAG: RagB/SusD family nutrient uptake outer membrane protein [Prevotellaceae bacterium]|jgi:hypothetical protein|nr:RagB/SusD family nutrient uptake outer membrane protein [Prevotellaceae bacterium]
MKTYLKNNFAGLITMACLFFTACSDYLDVVPDDDVATLDKVFDNRNSAERYLTTCYWYVPMYGSQTDNPGMAAGNDVWYYSMNDNRYVRNTWSFGIANGLQNVASPLNNYWDGEEAAKPMFQAISTCNIFIEYVSDKSRVSGLSETERKRWLAEAKVLKAFYHYYLFQLYGPIPICDKNIPITASPEELKITRRKVDEVVDYIVATIDSCCNDLPPYIQNEAVEAGRLTKVAALSIKAKTLLLAASDLFNGNSDYAHFVDHDGKPFINQTASIEKWARAAEACREAVEIAETAGQRKLYNFRQYSSIDLPDSLIYAMNVRQAVTERFNEELIWSCGKQSSWDLQCNSMTLLNPGTKSISSSDAQSYCRANYSPTLAVAELFYSDHGVPISEDTAWINPAKNYYNRRYQTERSTAADKYYIKENYETAILHFRREPRFYATLGFDGSTWYGNGWTLPDDASTRNYVEAKKNQISGQTTPKLYSITGYFAKKLIYYRNSYGSSVSGWEYPFPIIRLADLYLMYAEALNEASETPPAKVYEYIDKVRERSGLEGVQESWRKYTLTADKPDSKIGMREIIRHERQIELALEGQRFFDLRRWKTAVRELSKPIQGWSIDQETTAGFYQVRNIFYRQFYKKDYLWPIKEYNRIVNPQLIQTQGW